MTTPERPAATGSEIGHYMDAAGRLARENGLLRAALERIAAPCRPDGTWNLSRAACYQIAKEVLEVVGD